MAVPSLFLLLGLGVLRATASYLPSCAIECVNDTPTLCDATDYEGACMNSPYMAALKSCIQDTCDNQEQADTFDFLDFDLCSPSPTLTKGEKIELRQASFVSSAADASSVSDASFATATSEADPTDTGVRSVTATTRSVATSTDATTGAAATSGATNTGVPDSSDDNKGLSTGAKIGLGVGIPLGVIALAASVGGAYCFGRLSKSKADTSLAEMRDEKDVLESRLPELQDDQQWRSGHGQQQKSTFAELRGERDLAELRAERDPVELYGGSSRRDGP